MSALNRLIELEESACEFGLNWPNQDTIVEQIIDECREIKEEMINLDNQNKLQEEVGDLLHAAISLCLFSGFDVEETLEKINKKFSNRMVALKEATARRGLENLKGQSFEVMMDIWAEAKKLFP